MYYYNFITMYYFFRSQCYHYYVFFRSVISSNGFINSYYFPTRLEVAACSESQQLSPGQAGGIKSISNRLTTYHVSFCWPVLVAPVA
jgi:hypothetical protein